MKRRRLRRRLRVALGRTLPMVGLLLLSASAWLVTWYVLGRQAQLLPLRWWL